MMNLVPLEATPLVDFDVIIGHKEEPRRSILRRLRPRLGRLYRIYTIARWELAGLPRSSAYFGDRHARAAILGSHAYRSAGKKDPPPRSSFQVPEREALLQCYDGDTRGLTEMLDRVRQLQPLKQRWRCQYCCGVSASSTWDHYVHKAHFPEFSVYPPNLIPSCDKCNEFKKAWIKYGKRTCINFYYDRFDPTRPLIAAKIEIAADGDPEATFFLARRYVLNTRFGRLLARHWRMLQLERRLRDAAPATLVAIQSYIEVHADDIHVSATVLAQELASMAKKLGQALGANHIQTVLYRAAAASPTLIAYYLREGRT
ncbi:MAG: HNH endonuclease [Byssovorax sp.]